LGFVLGVLVGGEARGAGAAGAVVAGAAVGTAPALSGILGRLFLGRLLRLVGGVLIGLARLGRLRRRRRGGRRRR